MTKKTTAIVPYQNKRQKAIELYDKRCANLAKARAAKGKPLTRLEQFNRFNRSIQRIRKGSINAIIRSTNAICSILNSIPHVLDFWSKDLKAWVRIQHRERSRK